MLQMQALLKDTPWRKQDNEMIHSFERLTNGSLFTRVSLFDISPSRTRLSTVEACAPLDLMRRRAQKLKREATQNKHAELNYKEYFAAILPHCFPVALYAIDVTTTEPGFIHWYLPQVEETEIKPMREARRMQREAQNEAMDSVSAVRHHIRGQTSALFTAEQAVRSFAPFKMLHDQLPGIEENTKADKSQDQEVRRQMRQSARLASVLSNEVFTPATVYGGAMCFEGQVDQLAQAKEKKRAMANKRAEDADREAAKMAYLATADAIKSLNLGDPDTPMENFEVADKILGIYESVQGQADSHQRAPPVNYLMQNMIIAVQQAIDCVNGETTPRPFLCVSKKAGLLEYLREKRPAYFETYDPTRPKSQQTALPAEERERLRKSIPVTLLMHCLDFWEANPPGNVTKEQVQSMREFCNRTTQGKAQGPIDIADSILGAIAAHVLYSRGQRYQTDELAILTRAKQLYQQSMAKTRALFAKPTLGGRVGPFSRPAPIDLVSDSDEMNRSGAKVSLPPPRPLTAAKPTGKLSALPPPPKKPVVHLGKAKKAASSTPATGTGLFTQAQAKLQKDRKQSALDQFVPKTPLTAGGKAVKKPTPAALPTPVIRDASQKKPQKVHVAHSIRDLPRAQQLAQLAAARSRTPLNRKKVLELESDDEEEEYAEAEREREFIHEMVHGSGDSDDDFVEDDMDEWAQETAGRKRSHSELDDIIDEDDDDVDTADLMPDSSDSRKRRKTGMGAMDDDDEVQSFVHKHSKKKDSVLGGGYGVVRGSKGTWASASDLNDAGAF